jgi:23S rRNA (adenine2503-C2)-methyltransferase
MSKEWIIGKTLDELEEIVSNFGFEVRYARELSVSIYKRRCTSFSEINSLPIALRKALDALFSLEPMKTQSIQQSTDGTKKYLFKTAKGNPFETAYMPSEKRNTLCISTQSGCRMSCAFCFTAKLGFNENLSAGEIVSQYLSITEYSAVNKIVLMGMGEPLDNPREVTKALRILTANWGMALGAANLTLSTVGILPKLMEIADMNLCNFAISLHNPFPSERSEIAPAEIENPILKIVEFFRGNPLKKRLRLSFEYVVIPGQNDTEKHAIETVNLLKSLSCHVNVIALNSKTEAKQNEIAARTFQKLLNAKGLSATFRVSRGNDIDAACGMMAGKS